MNARTVGDLSHLPTSGFRSHGLWFWAALGFLGIEGAGFALAYATYIYLMNGAPQWPLSGKAPDLFWGTLQTVLLVASLVPNLILSRAARRRETGPTRTLSLVLAVFNAAALAVRALEFPHLNCHWDQDAYGSIVFALLLLHTVHLLTDFIDTGFLTLFTFIRPINDERFSDVDDDCVYWAFVVACWIPIYVLVYWAPRWAP
jgi:cytochrome c oxidase subunit 3